MRTSLKALQAAVMSAMIMISVFLLPLTQTAAVQISDNTSLTRQIMLLPHEKLAPDFKTLKELLGDDSTTIVYLSGNIQLESGGITVNPDKESLVIDGTNPFEESGHPYTITDVVSDRQEDNISLRTNGTLKNITLRNLHIDGKNHYGTFTIYETVRDVFITYQNINYIGPQLTFNQYGTSHYIDSTIYIDKNGSPSSPGEVAETSSVKLSGTVHMEQLYPQVNEIFFVEKQAGTIEVLPGADVTVQTFSESGFLYASMDVGLIVHEDASLAYAGPQRFWENQAMRDVTVKSGGSLSVHITSDLVNPLLQVNGDVVIEDGALFHLVNESSATRSLLTMQNGSLTIDNPRSVLFWCSSGRIMVFENENHFSMTAEQANVWYQAGSGDYSDDPQYHWHKDDESGLEISGAVSSGTSGNFLSVSTNFSDRDSAASLPPSPETMNLNSVKVFSCGTLALDACYQHLSESQIQLYGETEALSELRACYLMENQLILLADEIRADDTGYFQTSAGIDGLEDTDIFIEARWNYLQKTKQIQYTPMEFSVTIEPDQITFPATPVSATETLVQRDSGIMRISVTDSRGSSGSWQLFVEELVPLTPESETLPSISGGLVYRSGEQLVPLGGTRVLVASRQTDSPEHTQTLEWSATEGILAQIPAGSGYAGVTYHASILWTLSDTP